MDRLIREAAIITLARVTQEAGFEPESFIERYCETEKEADGMRDFLSLMEIAYEQWEEYSLWDDRFDTERGRYVLRWKNEL